MSTLVAAAPRQAIVAGLFGGALQLLGGQGQHTSLTMPTIRRYWYNTADGKAGSDKPLLEINIVALEAFARVFEVSVRDLIAPDDVKEGSEENSRPMRLAA